MTDKIDPGWVNDRLPTEEDANKQGVKNCVLVFDNIDGFLYRIFNKVKEGEPWSISTDEDWDELATPQECIDREKGEEKIFDNPDELLAMKRGKTVFRFPVKNWIDMANEPHERYKKIQDLEQALVKEKADHVETSKLEVKLRKQRWEAEQKVQELEKALAKSEERVKGLRDSLKIYHGRKPEEENIKVNDELFKDNQVLKQLLIKEWGGGE